jgi:hypothetical protein
MGEGGIKKSKNKKTKKTINNIQSGVLIYPPHFKFLLSSLATLQFNDLQECYLQKRWD